MSQFAKDITLVRYQCPIMSEGDGNTKNKDLVSQITANPNAIADLLHVP